MSVCCFDIGGTFIKYGVSTIEGKLLEHGKFATPKENCKINIPTKLSEYVNKAKLKYEIEVVGISTVGQVDALNGVITFANPNIVGYTGCEIVHLIESATGIKTYVENDANCAALGEMWVGAGKMFNNIVCFTLGTGVGGAVIINRKLHTGSHGCAGEMGNIRVAPPRGTPLGGSLDNCASTRALIESYEKWTGEEITGEKLLALVKKGDNNAVKMYDKFLKYLVTGIINAVDVIDPDVVIVGGGISAQGDFLFNPVNQMFKERTLASYRTIDIVKAELENDAGLLGACYIAINKEYMHI